MGKVAKNGKPVCISSNIITAMENNATIATMNKTATVDIAQPSDAEAASNTTMAVVIPPAPITEIPTATATSDDSNDDNQGDHEMEVDEQETVGTELVDSVPDNFCAVAEATFIRLRVKSLQISKQLVVLTTLMAGQNTLQQAEKLAHQYNTLNAELLLNKTATQTMQSSINQLLESEQPAAAVATTTAPTLEPNKERFIKPTLDMSRFNLAPTNSNETNIVRNFLERFVMHLETRFGMETRTGVPSLLN
ncbi:hypothetical protein BGW39_004206, partial [Mortierella sp. 14UC]